MLRVEGLSHADREVSSLSYSWPCYTASPTHWCSMSTWFQRADSFAFRLSTYSVAYFGTIVASESNFAVVWSTLTCSWSASRMMTLQSRVWRSRQRLGALWGQQAASTSTQRPEFIQVSFTRSAIGLSLFHWITVRSFSLLEHID